ncbi:MAG: DUF4382 domain-containing protein [Spirochaetes bacterium]|nr:DUF4382 domain-containing protein [Spirochaetota bacterium]
MRQFTLFFLMGLSLLFIVSACGSDTGDLKISLTDAPAATNFESIYVNFDRIEVSTSASANDDSSWQVINEDGGTVDLLTLNNGILHELGIASLAPGQYNQVRLYIKTAWVIVSGVSNSVHLASDTIKLVSPFTITAGITTELIVDFDAAHSINFNPALETYTLTPVTRLAQKDLTGAFKGLITSPPADVTITASAYLNGIFYSGTTCDDLGNFLLAYMDPGTYNILIEANGFQTVEITNQTIAAGIVNEYSGSINLIAN